MSTGVVLVANNTADIKYTDLANWSALNIHRHLDLPVTLITSNKVATGNFDKVIKVPRNKTKSTRYFSDLKKAVKWDNKSRHCVYELSPYEQTLVLDVDYVVGSGELRSIIDNQVDFIAFKEAVDVTGVENFSELNVFGKMKIPMYWATVMCFKKSDFSEAVFSMMEMVETHYTHYSQLYNFNLNPFRNDYALSIALNTLSGHCQKNIKSIPWRLKSTPPQVEVTQQGMDSYILRYQKNNKERILTLKDTDLHVMGKAHLMRIANGQK